MTSSASLGRTQLPALLPVAFGGTDKLTGFERTLTIADAGNAASKENGDALEDHD
jgi:hypothetical protein